MTIKYSSVGMSEMECMDLTPLELYKLRHDGEKFCMRKRVVDLT
jgi:hypothetical protein